jgi:hypothetical protein
MAQEPKITTGANGRPRNETIAQTGGGLPDDTSGPPEIDEAWAARVKDKLLGEAETPQPDRPNADEVAQGTPGSGENVCRRCSGTGMVEGRVCDECNGTGKVITPIGGG